MDTVVTDRLAKLKKNYDEARAELERAVKEDVGTLCKKNGWNFCARFQNPVQDARGLPVEYGVDYDALMALWRWIGDQLGEDPQEAVTGYCHAGEWVKT